MFHFFVCDKKLKKGGAKGGGTTKKTCECLN